MRSIHRLDAGYPSDISSFNPARQLAASANIRFLALFIAHIALGLLMDRNAYIATAHALAVLCTGFYFLLKDETPARLITLLAYLVGAEVIWRMTDARIFWEFGKYSATLFCGLAMLKHHRLRHASKWPVLFFALLTPAILLLPSFDRQTIAFNLSGPLSLSVALMFFSSIRLSQRRIRDLLLALLLAVIPVATIASYSTLSADFIRFGRSSIFVTSGGFGPNQVSSILGLGALAAVLYIFVERHSYFLRFIAVLAAVWFVAQAALTFSRGGIYTTVAALAVAGVFLLRDNRSRLTFFAGLTLVAAIWFYTVFPALNQYTGGALGARLANTDPSGRDLILQADILTFLENPLFGVGLGQSPEHHARLYRTTHAHTEFSRWLSEHGSLGLLALFMFAASVARRLFAPIPPFEKALVISCTIWAMVFMSHAAMRLVAPSFIFALGAATMSLHQKIASSETGQRTWPPPLRSTQ